MPLSTLRRLAPFAALAPILAATLYPTGATEPEGWVRCLFCGEHGLADFLVNVILFAPLGAALAWRGWSLRRVAVAAVLASGLVETAQLFIPGRDPSLGDILSNSLGALVAAGVLRLARIWLRPAAPGRWALAASLLASVALWTGGHLLTTRLPETVYYSQWTPNLGHLFWYRGRVLGATLGDLRLPPRRLENSSLVRRRILEGAPLVARVIAGTRTPRLAPIVSIYDDHQREIVLLGADREDLVWRMRAHASDFGLDQPDVRFRGALRGVARGDSLRVAAWRDGTTYCLSVTQRRRCGEGISPARSWALFMYPESLAQWVRVLLDGAWVAGLCIPVGLWSLGAHRVAAAVAAAILTAALALAPAANGIAAITALGWACAAAGWLAGAGAARLLRAR